MRTGAIAFFLAASIAAATISAAHAQDADYRRGWGPGPGFGWGYGQQMMRGFGANGDMMGIGPDAMLDRIDGRLAFLKAELKITSEQEAKWDEAASAIRTNAEAHNAMMRSMMEEMRDGSFAKLTLPERLAHQETQMSAHLQQIKAINTAIDGLYAVLSDEQKKDADDIVLPMMGMGMGRGGMGWGEMGGMMMGPGRGWWNR